jgi:hypothetical protein
VFRQLFPTHLPPDRMAAAVGVQETSTTKLNEVEWSNTDRQGFVTAYRLINTDFVISDRRNTDADMPPMTNGSMNPVSVQQLLP